MGKVRAQAEIFEFHCNPFACGDHIVEECQPTLVANAYMMVGLAQPPTQHMVWYEKTASTYLMWHDWANSFGIQIVDRLVTVQRSSSFSYGIYGIS